MKLEKEKQMKIKELFSDESKWTQNVLARDVNGEVCEVLSRRTGYLT